MVVDDAIHVRVKIESVLNTIDYSFDVKIENYYYTFIFTKTLRECVLNPILETLLAEHVSYDIVRYQGLKCEVFNNYLGVPANPNKLDYIQLQDLRSKIEAAIKGTEEVKTNKTFTDCTCSGYDLFQGFGCTCQYRSRIDNRFEGLEYIFSSDKPKGK